MFQNCPTVLIMIDLIQAEYQELWKEYGIEAIPVQKRNTPSTGSTFVKVSGSVNAPLLFVGELGTEDERELLSKIIEAMGYSREETPILELLKPTEIEQSLLDLKVQITRMKPVVVIALGETAALMLSGLGSDLSQMRGKWMKLHWDKSVELLSTYAPTYLIKNPSAKKLVWEDMKLVKKKLI